MDVKRQESLNRQWVLSFACFLGLISLGQVFMGQVFCRVATAQFSGGRFQPTTTGNQPVSSLNQSSYRPKSQNDTTFAGSQTAKINWIDGTNLAAAFRMAAEQNKPVLLHFWNERCQPCMSLEQFVFPNPILAEAINSNFIPVKVNTLKTPEIHHKYGVKQIPWDVFVSPTGIKLRENSSERSASRYTQLVKSIAKMHGGLAAAATPQKPKLDNRPSFGNNSMSSTSMSSTSMTSPGMSLSTTPPSTTPPSTVPPSTVPPSSSINSLASRNPAAADRRNNQAFQSGSPNTQNRSQANPSLVQNKFFTKPQAPQATANQPPVGMEGYCPVSMLRDTKKIAGSKEWGCIHRGKLYFFANQNYRDIFMKAPDQYAPVLAGFDIVIYRETGELIEGKTKFGGFVGQPGKQSVFLFSSEENKRKFIADKQGRYLETARVATRNAGENWLR